MLLHINKILFYNPAMSNPESWAGRPGDPDYEPPLHTRADTYSAVAGAVVPATVIIVVPNVLELVKNSNGSVDKSMAGIDFNAHTNAHLSIPNPVPVAEVDSPAALGVEYAAISFLGAILFAAISSEVRKFAQRRQHNKIIKNQQRIKDRELQYNIDTEVQKLGDALDREFGIVYGVED
jgi:hypothetical protein